VLNICDRLQPDGVIVQFGGQTPLNLARGLEAAGVKIIGTSPDMIDAAEDREKFQRILERLGLRQPPNGIATHAEEARVALRERIGYPGARAAELCARRPGDGDLLRRTRSSVEVHDAGVSASPDRPVLIDKFLEDATKSMSMRSPTARRRSSAA
jgi:carbamoyl-phosphate synthase large subunit